jgi:hypothetical protein
MTYFPLLAGHGLAQQNATFNSYWVGDGWLNLPDGRRMGLATKVALDRDGKSLWVFDRCGAADCVGSMVDPIAKFDPLGNLVVIAMCGRPTIMAAVGSIDQQIKRALSVGPVSTGDNLVGFQKDVLCFLEWCELFASVEVKITDGPHCVLEASCVVVDDAASDDTVASTLERIWLDHLCYGAEEAHALGSDREGVSLRWQLAS